MSSFLFLKRFGKWSVMLLAGLGVSVGACHAQTVLPDDAGFSNPGYGSVASAPRAQSPAAILVNNTHVRIDYKVEKVGPSGIGKIEVYATTDHGQTWKRVGVDTDLTKPIMVDLPGEGVYGIRLVGINGNGIGGKKPVAGDLPTTIIEVDLNGPKVQDWKVTPGKNGVLDIQWNASDKNMGPEPVNLSYRTKANEPWKVMAQKLKNDGHYQWPINRDPAPLYFVRLEVRDRAGNVTSCETTDPVLVDRTEPDIHIQGIRVIQTRGEAPWMLVPTGIESEN